MFQVTLLEDLFYSVKTADKQLFLRSYASILSLPSYYDLKDENSYPMLLLGVCAWLMNDYEIQSNREAGIGRCDILLKSKNNTHPSYVFEFKYISSFKNNELEKLADLAIAQIEEKRYGENLVDPVIYIGLAHCGKEVEIKWKVNKRD